MTSPYRQRGAAARADVSIAGELHLLPRGSSRPWLVRLVFTVPSMTLFLGWVVWAIARRQTDLLPFPLFSLWISLVVGPLLGALFDGMLARSGFEKRRAEITEEGIVYRSWGFARRVDCRDISCVRRVDGESGEVFVLGMQNGAPSMLFCTRSNTKNLPAWLANAERRTDCDWSFRWRARSPLLLGSRGTAVWLIAAAAFTAGLWLHRSDMLGWLFVLLWPFMAGGAVIVLILLFERPYRVGDLKKTRTGWLLHVSSPFKTYVLPVASAPTVEAPSIRVLLEDAERVLVAPGGSLSEQEQVAIIAALGTDGPDKALTSRSESQGG